MATLAIGGRIGVDDVKGEIACLHAAWAQSGVSDGHNDVLLKLLGPNRAARLDRFDRMQLAEVVRVCRTTDSLSEAGRILFAETRKTKANPNDADRLRKYLARFDLEWKQLRRSS